MIFYNFNQNAVTFVRRLERKTSWEKHCSLPFKNTKMSTLPKHLHWTWTILSEWIICGSNYKWGHYKLLYSESAVTEHEWVIWVTGSLEETKKGLISNSWWMDGWVWRCHASRFWAKLWKLSYVEADKLYSSHGFPTEISKVLVGT